MLWGSDYNVPDFMEITHPFHKTELFEEVAENWRPAFRKAAKYINKSHIGLLN